MKKIILFYLIINSSLQLFSQSRENPNLLSESKNTALNKNSKNQLSFRFGLAIPSGSFANSDISVAGSGLAKTGTMFETEYRSFLTPSIYFGTILRIQANNIVEDGFVENYREQIPSNFSVTFDSKPWVNRSLMSGLGMEGMVWPKALLFSRFMMGITHSSSTSFDATITNGVTIINETQSKSNTRELSYMLGIGLKLALSPKTNLIIASDYFLTHPTYENVEYKLVQNRFVTTEETFSFSQKIEIITISTGLSFNL